MDDLKQVKSLILIVVTQVKKKHSMRKFEKKNDYLFFYNHDILELSKVLVRI